MYCPGATLAPTSFEPKGVLAAVNSAAVVTSAPAAGTGQRSPGVALMMQSTVPLPSASVSMVPSATGLTAAPTGVIEL